MKSFIAFFTILILSTPSSLALLQESEINTDNEPSTIISNLSTSEILITDIDPSNDQVSDSINGTITDLEGENKPKKKKKIIKNLIYYLGAGFVLMLVLMYFFLRRKPKA